MREIREEEDIINTAFRNDHLKTDVQLFQSNFLAWLAVLLVSFVSSLDTVHHQELHDLTTQHLDESIKSQQADRKRLREMEAECRVLKDKVAKLPQELAQIEKMHQKELHLVAAKKRAHANVRMQVEKDRLQERLDRAEKKVRLYDKEVIKRQTAEDELAAVQKERDQLVATSTKMRTTCEGLQADLETRKQGDDQMRQQRDELEVVLLNSEAARVEVTIRCEQLQSPPAESSSAVNEHCHPKANERCDDASKFFQVIPNNSVLTEADRIEEQRRWLANRLAAQDDEIRDPDQQLATMVELVNAARTQSELRMISTPVRAPTAPSSPAQGNHVRQEVNSQIQHNNQERSSPVRVSDDKSTPSSPSALLVRPTSVSQSVAIHSHLLTRQ